MRFIQQPPLALDEVGRSSDTRGQSFDGFACLWVGWLDGLEGLDG